MIPPENQRVTLTIPLPVSTNNLTAHSRRNPVFSSPAYVAWMKEAGLTLIEHGKVWRGRTVTGHFGFAITLPEGCGDVDNRTKATLDLLHTMKITPDDRMCRLTLSGFSPDLPPSRARFAFWPLPADFHLHI